MSGELIVNRYLKTKAMDRIDHALGRPLDPLGETYRNYYTASGIEAVSMAVSPFWIEGRRIPGGLRCFAVTDEGRRALATHLQVIGDKHRAYAVTFDRFTREVVATSHSKARYSYFLDLQDVMPDLTFEDYCRRTKVRLARSRTGGAER